jgi:hypothetical protein
LKKNDEKKNDPANFVIMSDNQRKCITNCKDHWYIIDSPFFWIPTLAEGAVEAVVLQTSAGF